jgi:hypothetical protein
MPWSGEKIWASTQLPTVNGQRVANDVCRCGPLLLSKTPSASPSLCGHSTCMAPHALHAPKAERVATRAPMLALRHMQPTPRTSGYTHSNALPPQKGQVQAPR